METVGLLWKTSEKGEARCATRGRRINSGQLRLMLQNVMTQSILYCALSRQKLERSFGCREFFSKRLLSSDPLFHDFDFHFVKVDNASSFVDLQYQFLQRHCVLLPLATNISNFFRSYMDSKDVIVTGYIVSDLYNRSNVIEIIGWNFSSLLIHFHNQFFKQTRGIPQGSILSFPLCNLYLREYEKRVLSPVVHSPFQTTVVRFVDDYLFITSDRSVITQLENYVRIDFQILCIVEEKRFQSIQYSFRKQKAAFF